MKRFSGRPVNEVPSPGRWTRRASTSVVTSSSFDERFNLPDRAVGTQGGRTRARTPVREQQLPIQAGPRVRRLLRWTKTDSNLWSHFQRGQRFRARHSISRAAARAASVLISENSEGEAVPANFPTRSINTRRTAGSRWKRLSPFLRHAAAYLRRGIAQSRKTPSHRGGGLPPSHPNSAGWRRRIRPSSSIGSDPLKTRCMMHEPARDGSYEAGNK